MVRLYGLGQLVTSCSVFFGGDLLALRNKAGSDAVPGKSLAVEGSLRLHELEGGTEVTPSKVTRGDWKRGKRLSRSVMER